MLVQYHQPEHLPVAREIPYSIAVFYQVIGRDSFRFHTHPPKATDLLLQPLASPALSPPFTARGSLSCASYPPSRSVLVAVLGNLTGCVSGCQRRAGCGYAGTRVLTSIRSGWCLRDTEEELQFAADLKETGIEALSFFSFASCVSRHSSAFSRGRQGILPPPRGLTL